MKSFKALSQKNREDGQIFSTSKRRVIASVLSVCIILAMIPVMSLMTSAATADKNIMLGVGNIAGYDSANGYEYLYYGTDEAAPIKWRVLDNKTNTGADGFFLISESLLGESEYYGGVDFDKDPAYSNVYQGSDAQKWCDTFESSNLTATELAAIIETTKSDATYNSYSATENILNGDKVFFLSVEEANNAAYGFNSNDDRKSQSAGCWWLRSPYTDDSNMSAFVENDGRINNSSVWLDWAARPAFNLNTDSVLFTCAAVGGKTSGDIGPRALTAISDYQGNEWKATVIDSTRSFAVTESSATAAPGEKVILNYTGAREGENEYVSVILTDESGNPLYYGNVAQNSMSGKAEITLPADLALGSYTLKLFSEELNGDKMTDYASEFETVALTVNFDGAANIEASQNSVIQLPTFGLEVTWELTEGTAEVSANRAAVYGEVGNTIILTGTGSGLASAPTVTITVTAFDKNADNFASGDAVVAKTQNDGEYTLTFKNDDYIDYSQFKINNIYDFKTVDTSGNVFSFKADSLLNIRINIVDEADAVNFNSKLYNIGGSIKEETSGLRFVTRAISIIYNNSNPTTRETVTVEGKEVTPVRFGALLAPKAIIDMGKSELKLNQDQINALAKKEVEPGSEDVVIYTRESTNKKYYAQHIDIKYLADATDKFSDYNVVLNNIPNNQKSQNITYCTYMIYKNADNTYSIIYSDVAVRSYSEVAKALAQ